MADTTNKLPEGTDTVIEAGGTGGTSGGLGRSGTGSNSASTSFSGQVAASGNLMAAAGGWKETAVVWDMMVPSRVSRAWTASLAVLRDR